jgi:phosphoribosylanthranilate isomerase
MIVQVYEVNNPEEAIILAALGVDHIGVLVGKGEYPRELSPTHAKAIFNSLSTETKRVALSLSQDLEILYKVARGAKPDILHLGALPELLSPSDIKKLKKEFPHLKIMRSIPVIDKVSIELAKAYEGIADYLLLDSYQQGDTQVGATGKVHDWSLSRRIVESVQAPVILAGGLGPDNVAEAIRAVKPAGVDSKTKTDRIDGKGKDMEKVKKFVRITKLL